MGLPDFGITSLFHYEEYNVRVLVITDWQPRLDYESLLQSPERQFSSESRRSKSFEEREEEYEKARKRIFNREVSTESLAPCNPPQVTEATLCNVTFIMECFASCVLSTCVCIV
jgi:hypothetical protein